jgi:hypothetical protein
MIVGQSMTIAAIPRAALLVGALALTRTIAGLLYEVTPTDPVTFATVAGMLALTTVAASCAPAIKGALVQPVVALRCE